MLQLIVDDVLFIHDRLIETSGGLGGIRDKGLLESAINKPETHVFGIERYKGINAKAAAILEAIALFHPFNDGNKRTALAAASFYLFLNGYSLYITNEEYEGFMLTVVQKKLSIKKIAVWFNQHSQPLHE